MATTQHVKDKLMRILPIHYAIRMDNDGDIYIERDSTLCWVMVREWGQQNPDRDDNVLIKVEAPVLWDVKRSPEVYQWVATEGQYYSFGRAICYKGKADDLTNLYFSCTILGDNVDEAEIISVINAVLDSANKLDDELLPKFGGRLTRER